MRTIATMTALLLLAFAGLALLPGLAEAQDARGLRYEYAELRINANNDALVILADRAVFLDGPREREQVRVQANTKIDLVIPNQVIYLTRLGAEGWELAPGQSAGPESTRFLLRRAY